MKKTQNLILLIFMAVLFFGCDNSTTTPGEQTNTVASPVIAPEPDTTNDYVEVSISCAEPGAVIYYTLDGTDPTVNSTLYTVPFILYEDTTVKAVAAKADMDNSGITIASYIVVYNPDGDVDGDGLLNSEELTYGTSLMLADTDGDGYTDYEEIRELGFNSSIDPYKFNPLISDIPEIQILLTSAPKIILNMESSISSATEITTGRTTETANTVTTSETTTNTTSIETSVSRSRKTFSITSRPLAMSPVGTNNYKTTTTKEESFAWSEEQSQENRESLSQSEALSQEEGFRYIGGELKMTVKLVNSGDIAFTLESLLLSAVQLDPFYYELTLPIGNLDIDSDSVFPPTTLGPGEEITNLVFIKDDLDLTTANDLLESKSGLIIAPTLYELKNEAGVAFAHDLTEIGARTATVIIDYGPLNSKAPESYKVATNGGTTSITMDGILTDILKIPYVDDSGLTSLGGVEDDLANNKSWNVIHLFTEGGVEDYEVYAKIDEEYSDFANIAISAGEVVQFIYMDDSDGDDLGAREEAIFGTDPTLSDTDSDGLDDGVEIYGISVSGITRGDDAILYTSPLADDTDNDGTDDNTEVNAGTDPTSRFPITRNYPTDYEYIRDMVVFPGGGIIVAGVTDVEQLYYDAAETILYGQLGTWQLKKYMDDGNEVTAWSNTKDGYNHRYTSPYALVMGSDGALYAAGVITEMSNIAHEENWHIAKYDPTGIEITTGWPKTIDFDGASSSSYHDRALAIASFEQYIYVGGYGHNNGSTYDKDWALKKFNSDGTEVTSGWAKFIDISEDDEITGLVTDSVGDVYAVGHTQNIVDATSGKDIYLVKYLANGTEGWIKSLEFVTGKNDTVNDIAISGDRLFICGSVEMDDGYNTRKWWVKAFSLIDGIEDSSWELSGGAQGEKAYANAMEIDRHGNLYLAIQSQLSGYPSRWAIKRWDADKTVNTDWNINTSGDGDYPRAIAIRPSGEVYIAGEIAPGYFDSQWHIRKYYAEE
ncbi:MAG: chitobiase/beta-hexosaminidase C-terminal domain-containing protein [Spirochaetales bacterium]|nr:chitobiase/beta-hexosaminidase C-terminal domain-containing protein [Spirochaetales bacterium]